MFLREILHTFYAIFSERSNNSGSSRANRNLVKLSLLRANYENLAKI